MPPAGIEFTSKAKSVLATRGHNKILGARPLRRTIQREIEGALSEKIRFGEVKSGQIILIDVDGDKDSEGITTSDVIFHLSTTTENCLPD